MLYFDTSILTPLVLPEATGAAVEAFMRNVAADEWSTSQWALVEFASLAAKHVRLGNMRDDEARDAVTRFDGLLASSFKLFLPSVEDFTLAKRYLGHFETGLRGGDALHLAIAVSNGARVVYTLDKPMLKACRMLKIDGRAGIDWPGYN